MSLRTGSKKQKSNPNAEKLRPPPLISDFTSGLYLFLSEISLILNKSRQISPHKTHIKITHINSFQLNILIIATSIYVYCKSTCLSVIHFNTVGFVDLFICLK